MYKWIYIHIRDNQNDDFIFIHPMKVTLKEYTILQNYEMDEYDEIYDKICDTLERIMPYGMDWYIDTIKFNKE